jgi:hypothetical protein
MDVSLQKKRELQITPRNATAVIWISSGKYLTKGVNRIGKVIPTMAMYVKKVV